jgi:hypothetical protein
MFKVDGYLEEKYRRSQGPKREVSPLKTKKKNKKKNGVIMFGISH